MMWEKWTKGCLYLQRSPHRKNSAVILLGLLQQLVQYLSLDRFLDVVPSPVRMVTDVLLQLLKVEHLTIWILVKHQIWVCCRSQRSWTAVHTENLQVVCAICKNVWHMRVRWSHYLLYRNNFLKDWGLQSFKFFKANKSNQK